MSEIRPTRSNYFIQAGLQIKFTFVLVMIVMLVAAITFLNLYIIGRYVIDNANTVIELRTIDSFLMTVFQIVGWRIVTLMIVCLLIISIIGIFYSHQFAGPSYKLEKCLKEISQGDFSFSIRLRNGDALHNVATSINLLVDQIRSIITSSRESSDALRTDLESLLKKYPKDEEVKTLLKRVAQLEDLYAGFCLTREEVERLKDGAFPESQSNLEEDPENSRA